MPGTHVADLELKKDDSLGDTILVFYGRKPPEYAVYRTRERVLVHFADSDKRAAEQRKALASLNPLRGEINGLIDGWRASRLRGDRSRAERYDRRVGDAMVVAFEGDIEGARQILETVKRDILEERTGRGRVEYLIVALAVGVFGLIVIAIAVAQRDTARDVDLWRAAAAGAFGAFFSISMAMRDRTVLPNLERQANLMDAALRMAIGMIAAAVLISLIRVDAVNIAFGGRRFTEGGRAAAAAAAEYDWLVVLVIGFLAGFSERFVPDLLGRAAGLTEARAARAAARAPAPPTRTDAAPGQPSDASGAGTEASAQASEDEADPLPEEAAADTCVENVDLPDEQATHDIDLPPAAGGVEPLDEPIGRS